MSLVEKLRVVAWSVVIGSGLQAGLLQASDEGAAWQLDAQASQISFVTTKAQDIAEVHTFGELSGALSLGASKRASGEINLEIDLASVETGIPIRNERMLEFLFEVVKFPNASVHGHVPVAEVLELPVGGSVSQQLKLMLDLHGQRIPITVDVLALRVGVGRVMVTSVKPVIVNAASVDLVAGIDKLQQLASLPSIGKAVPVSFVLTFVGP